jgi:hypothetical protein
MLVEAVAIDGCMNGMNAEAPQAAYVRTGAATPCYPSTTASGTAAFIRRLAMTPRRPITMLEICPRCGFREIDDDETGWCGRCAGVRVTDSYQERKLNQRRQRWLEWLADRRSSE